MNKKDLIDALFHLKVETGSLACLGCGHEHDCGIHGCAIIRKAVMALQMSPVYQCQVCDCKGLTERLRESVVGNKYPMPAMLLDAATTIEALTAQLTASEAARADLGKRLAAAEQELAQVKEERSWISVKDRLPETDEVVLVLASGKPKKNITLDMAYELAEYDPLGWILEMWPEWMDAVVTHWMPLPEPPEKAEAALKGGDG